MKNKEIFYCLFLAILVIIVTVDVVRTFDGTPSTVHTAPRTSKNNVILRALQGATSVQMFAELSNNRDIKVTTFPDGFGCYKLSDLLTYNDGYGEMYFYRLNCNGRVGYVNAMWVKARAPVP